MSKPKLRGKKSKRSKKVRIKWHYDKTVQKSLPSQYVFIHDGIRIPSSGRWHLRGFDLRQPQRFVAFHTKPALRIWAKQQHFHVKSFKKWKRYAKRIAKKGSFPWRKVLHRLTHISASPSQLTCPHCGKPLPSGFRNGS